jgi:toxin FitB
LRKGERTNGAVKNWADSQPPHTLFLSIVTLAEIRFGIELADDPKFQQELTLWLENHLLRWFAGRVLEVTEEVFLNHTFSQPDLFIAATAALHGLGVATRNIEDFRVAGVAVVNPWKFNGRVSL